MQNACYGEGIFHYMVALHLEVGYNESSFQLENNMILSRKKYCGQDPGKHIEVIHQYDVADL